MILVLATLAGATLHAQVSPNKPWRSLRTEHFYVHFTPETEPMARRAAAAAERAYAELSTELHPPRGPIDIVVSDDADFSNGSATPFPTNRIVVYANPPIEDSSLRDTDDWTEMVVTHELTHIFHLDRTRGIWRLAQGIFGRSPYLFPNTYTPSWLTEGLAVYYESRFTGAGRLAGSEHRMIARASAIDRSLPALSQVSLAAPSYPFGESAYAYGSLLVEYLAQTRGAEHVRDYVERSSGFPIPFLIDIPARQGFGVSFTRGYREWSDSVNRSVADVSGNASSAPMPGWRDVTRGGAFVAYPRWFNDRSLTFTGTDGRDAYAAWQVDLDGRTRRLGRRNSASPQAPLPGGGLLFAQLEFTNPYQIRSDLYVQQGRGERRLTHGARLSQPDARADGAIVAVQTIPSGTRLARVSADGRTITPITSGGLDEGWTEPRWSHAGDRIAAIRWRRGGIFDVVVVDTAGRELNAFAGGHSVQAAPSWTAGDSALVYSSDRTGTAQIYLTTLANGHEYRVSDVATGLFEPAATAGKSLAAIVYRSDGYHLGLAPCCQLDSSGVATLVQQGTRPTPTVAVDSSPSRSYSPWRMLVPRYWAPSFASGIHSGEPRIGLQTSAYDAIRRHYWSASLAAPTDNSGIVGGIGYEYAGFGLPIIDLSFTQDWTLTGVVTDRSPQPRVLGEVRRRIQDGEADATFIKRGYRSAIAFVAGTGVEQYMYAGVPLGTLALVDTSGIFKTRYYPRVLAGVSYARTQAAPYSVSPEDGFTVAATVRDRWRTDVARSGSYSVVGAATGYKSLNLPGFAHHVLALRAAAGAYDDHATGYLEVGGTSGTQIDVLAGFTVGEGRKDFGVRGFEAASLVGTRALAGSAEYRVPLFKAGRGLGLLPFFLDRSAITFFGDYGSAWCPYAMTGLVCTASLEAQLRLTQHRYLASYGAELDLNAAVLSWDAPYRLRFGVAHPAHDDGLFAPASKVSVYFASGLSF